MNQAVTPRARGLWFHIFDVLLNIAIIIAIVGVIRTFIVSPFQVEGNSMDSTLSNREYIVINKFRYLFGDPQRGDIVVFHPPTDHKKYYVKRVIGLPGETIVVRDGYVYVRNPSTGTDTKLSEEAYLNAVNLGSTFQYPVSSGNTTEEVFIVPADQYFLLGDNRMLSLDSRSFAHIGHESSAFIPRSNVKGSVWFVALPISKIQAFEPPTYGDF